MSDVMEEIKQDDMIASNLGSVYFGLTPKWPEGARYQSKKGPRHTQPRKVLEQRPPGGLWWPTRETTEGGLGGWGTVRRWEKRQRNGRSKPQEPRGSGEELHRIPRLMGRHWRRVYTEEQHNLVYTFKGWLWLLCGKWIVQGSYCSHSNKGRRLVDRFGGYFRRHAHRTDVGEDVWCRERQKKDEF